MKTSSAKKKAFGVDLAFSALSDRTRLRILHMLKGGELCVCDLVGVLRVSQPKVSRHLSYLRRAKLVQVRKDGLWCFYKLTPASSDFHTQLLSCLSASAAEIPETQDDAARLAKVKDCC
jgi:ArsR family transcriptional regulator